jgi:transcriptional regulator with XRE-family HTH domain
MNLSEKIMLLRKKQGWSQEELANRLNISRQSISKWESGQSQPDIDKIILLSQLFQVTTDYLLLDQENEEHRQIGIYLSLSQVQEYLTLRKQSSLKIAFATFLCVISPIPLIGLTTLSQYQRFHMTENLAVSLGLSFLIICITIAVILFCLCAFKVKKYEFLEKDDFSLENGVKEYTFKEKEEYQDRYHRYQIIGIVLCILSVLPIFIFLNYEFLESIAVCILLFFVSIGCFFLVLAGTYQNALDKILQTGDYTPKQKKNNILKSKISTIYWLVVTAIFLYYTFGKNGNGQMQYSWIIWAIAGVLFGVLMIVIDLINKRRD